MHIAAISSQLSIEDCYELYKELDIKIELSPSKKYLILTKEA